MRSDGSIERRKARLVAKGFHQQIGIDYTETFSPVVKSSTIRLVLSITVARGWCLRQIDIQNAFLHSKLSETVFMQQPQGFIDPLRPNFVCKLNKAIYGLKQAPRAWFSELSSWLISYGFSASKGDPSLFVMHTSTLCMFILVYVDDMVITSSSSIAVDDLLTALGKVFLVKDLGPLSYFLGLEVENLVDASTKLSKFDSPSFDDTTLFRSTVGSLQYLSLTRPDVSFAVNRVCQFMRDPKLPHWTAVKRILHYLKSTINYGLFLSNSSPFTLHAYSDSDWVGCPDDRRSTDGFCIFLGNHLISWS
ncbi:hypothetical protein F2P56_011184 [Juglans regia]|uniref:Reverse transcriptase Ty1/copia-type domain-containing protein n=1 Tax=Juglans regia TaxID=51240 RepID=A0A833XL31_JUGRE|nr:hypothetical protein F2P56_011184 [Juglans regia]